MAEEKENSKGWIKYAVIIGIILVIVVGVLAVAFIYFIPSWVAVSPTGEGLAPTFEETIMRMVIVFVMAMFGIVFIAGIVLVIYEWFFKKKELHIVKEYQKIAKESAMLNPVTTMRNLVMTGKHQVQSYSVGKIVGHTQIPVKFQRIVFIDQNGKVIEDKSEAKEDFDKRRLDAMQTGKHLYDLFAFVTQRGLYALPFFSMLEPPKIFACYPAERSQDLLGDVEIFDVGTWKLSGVNLFIPGSRSREPDVTINEIKAQVMPIAYMSMIDYIGLIAQRGIEGDTSMQKWIQAKASTLNVKENA